MNTKDTVAVASRSFSQNTFLVSKLKNLYSSIILNETGKTLEGGDLINFLKPASKAIIGIEAMPDHVLSELPNLKVISKYGVGLNNLDLELLRNYKIKLGFTPGVNKQSVAELALTLILIGLKKIQDNKKTILLNKPVGYISHAEDEKKYQSALTLIKPENYFGQEKMTNTYFKIAPAGRLDIDSTGLLVLTEDGVIAKQIIKEDSDIEKEYIVRVQGQLIENGLKLLNYGLFLDNKALKKACVNK